MNIMGRDDVAAKASTLVLLQGAPSRRADGCVRIFTTSVGAVMMRKRSFLHLELSLGNAEENMKFLVWHLAGDAGQHQAVFDELVESAVRAMAPRVWRKMEAQPTTTFYLHREKEGGPVVSGTCDYTECIYPQVLDPIYILWLLSEAEAVERKEPYSSYCPLTENCQHYVMRRVTPTRLSRLQDALSSRTLQSDVLASGEGATAQAMLTATNPALGLFVNITVAAFSAFISFVRENEIEDVESHYTDAAERETQNAFEAALQNAMREMQASRSQRKAGSR